MLVPLTKPTFLHPRRANVNRRNVLASSPIKNEINNMTSDRPPAATPA